MNLPNQTVPIMSQNEILPNSGIARRYAGRNNTSTSQQTSSNLQVPLLRDECCLVIDTLMERVVEQFGFQSFLGIASVDLSLETLRRAVHPDDLHYVNRIYQSILFRYGYSQNNVNENILNICYRFKRKTGEYFYLLNRVYIDSVSSDGRIATVLIKYEDVSFIGNSNKIVWESSLGINDLLKLENDYNDKRTNLFTPRELDIIKHIIKGKTNQQISDDLNISYHTVTTHRKHIFKKVNCHSPSELIMFLHKNNLHI